MKEIFQNGDWYGEGQMGSSYVQLCTTGELSGSLQNCHLAASKYRKVIFPIM